MADRIKNNLRDNQKRGIPYSKRINEEYDSESESENQKLKYSIDFHDLDNDKKSLIFKNETYRIKSGEYPFIFDKRKEAEKIIDFLMQEYSKFLTKECHLRVSSEVVEIEMNMDYWNSEVLLFPESNEENWEEKVCEMICDYLEPKNRKVKNEEIKDTIDFLEYRKESFYDGYDEEDFEKVNHKLTLLLKSCIKEGEIPNTEDQIDHQIDIMKKLSFKQAEALITIMTDFEFNIIDLEHMRSENESYFKDRMQTGTHEVVSKRNGFNCFHFDEKGRIVFTYMN